MLLLRGAVLSSVFTDAEALWAIGKVLWNVAELLIFLCARS